MHESARRSFQFYQSPAAALRYEGVHGGRSRHHRELRCLQRALEDLPPGAEVLDLPCGTGRMFPALAARERRITAVDGSREMARRARLAVGAHPGARGVGVADVFATGFPDGAFDAVVCNRLLHHFTDSEDRRAALRELARLTRRRLIVSFFCSRSLDALRARLRRSLGGRAASRPAVDWPVFRRDVEASGLRVTRVIPTLPGISQQWYVVADR